MVGVEWLRNCHTFKVKEKDLFMKFIKVIKDFFQGFWPNNSMNGKAFTVMEILGDRTCYFSFV